MPVTISTISMPNCSSEIQVTSQAIQYKENCMRMVAISKLCYEDERQERG